MEVYKADNTEKDMFYFVYLRKNDAVMVLRVSSGSLGKFKFSKFPEEKFDKFHQKENQYKGPFPDDVKKRLLEAIFWVKQEILTQGPDTWA